MSAVEGVFQASRRWFARASGLPLAKVIAADDLPGTRPDLPYASIRLSPASTRRHRDEVVTSVVDGVLRRNIIGHRSATVAVNVYGPGALGYVESSTMYVDLDNAEPAGEEGVMVIRDVLSTQNLSGLLDTSSEERALVEFDAGYCVTFAQGVEAEEIEEIAVTGEGREIVVPEPEE